jgi:hypothetical protein
MDSSAPSGGASPREINGESSLKALWKLIYRAIQTQKIVQNYANSDFARILTSDLQENFEKWRKNLRNNFPINIEKSKRGANELNKCLSNRGLGLQ